MKRTTKTTKRPYMPARTRPAAREKVTTYLDPALMATVREIARADDRSVSWVIEQLVHEATTARKRRRQS